LTLIWLVIVFKKMDHLGFHRHSSEKTVSFLMRDKYFKDAYKAVD
jgi:hypothetical protein